VSNNLNLSQVAAAQNNKEVTINDQAGQLDAGLTDKVDVALTGTTSPLVLSDAQALRCMVLKLTGTHPGGAVLRTETGIGSASFTYTSAMQAADFGGAQTELSFVVYQISTQVGCGFASEATVEMCHER
jgi:hypothetical protein